MKASRGIFAAALSVAFLSIAQARYEEEETAVFAKSFNDYARTPSALGGYKSESFAFANGGALTGRFHDASVEKATFDQVVRLISPALARQNYIPAVAPEDTDLLIYVYWGTTDGSVGSAGVTDSTMQQAGDLDADWYGAASLLDDANRQRDRANFSNAGLLGYRQALATHMDIRSIGVHTTMYQDLIADVEEPRYFVVLTAFDFKTAWQNKKLIPLWSTRYNIPARGNHFTTALPDMSMFASRFFGRDSGGLVRRLNPTGKVEMGDIKVLGAVETPIEDK